MQRLDRVIREELFKAFSKLKPLTNKALMRAAEEANMDPLYASRLVEALGEDETLELLTTKPDQIHRTIRVNTLKARRSTVRRRLEEEGFETQYYTPTPYGIIILGGPYSPGASKEYLKGLYTLQGPASMQAVLALQPIPAAGEPVLDLCAGAGVKATQIAQHTKAAIISIDISRRKLHALRNNASRLGATNIVAVCADATKIKLPLNFKRILLDAPCTGEGLVPLPRGRRRRRRLTDLPDRVILQATLLNNAVRHLSPGGVLVYATCSTAVEENEYVVSKILSIHEDLTLQPPPIDIGSPGINNYLGLPLDDRVRLCTRLYPHRHYTEGFTICRILRRA